MITFILLSTGLILQYPVDIYNICLDCLKKEIEQKYSYFNLSLDNFKEIRNNEADYDINILYLRLMLVCLEKFDDTRLSKLYSKYISSKNRFYSKLAIYIANLKFDLFKDLFIDKIEVLVGNRHYYGEIYSYLTTHKNEFTDNEIKKIGISIDKLLFENEFLTKANKYDLFNIFSDLSDNYCKMMAGIIKNTFTEKDWENYNNYISPNERGKSIWTSVSNINKDSNNYKDKIMKMNPLEYIDLFSNYGTEISFVASNLFDEYEEKNKLFDYVLNNKDLKLPQRLIYVMFEYIQKNDESTSIINLLKEEYAIFCMCKDEDKDELTLKFVRDMFYIYCDRSKKVQVEDLNFINDFLDNNINYDLLDCKMPSNINIDINTILSNDSFICYYMKLVCLMIINPSKTEEFILRKWNVEQINIINLCICSTLDRNLLIHSDWTISNLKNIFLKENLIDKYAITAFSLCPSYDEKILNELTKLGVLEYIFNTYKDSTFASTFAAQMIYSYIKNKFDNYLPFIKAILRSKCFGHALIYLKGRLVKIDYTQDDIQRIGLFFELIIKESIYKAEYSHLIVELLHFYKEEALRSRVIDVVEKLVTFGTKPYYCDRIIEITKKIDFCLEDKKRIIYSYLSNLTEHYFHTEDIIKLYNCIDWIGDVRGIELKNKLGQINPEFLLKLKNN